MALVGIGAEKFSVDVNGTVRVIGAVDYESKKVYHLRAVATNAKADSPEAEVTVEVENVAEFVPVLKPFSVAISEIQTVGSIIGEIEVSAGDSPITTFEINGTKSFSIDIQGQLKVLKTIDYWQAKTHSFTVRAFNTSGYSDAVTCRVDVIPDDQIKPVLSLVGAVNVYVTENTPYVDLGVIAYDNIDGVITHKVETLNPVNTNAIVGSSFVVTYSVEDNAGNEAESLSRIVTIVRELNTNLAQWKANGQGNWILQAGNKSVLQTINGEPTVFHNNIPSQNDVFTLNGKITVKTTGDDDFIGFVLGYNEGDLFRNNIDYLLIDWKQGTQGSAPRGLAISRITKAINAGAWIHSTAQGIQELQRGKTLGNVGWRDNQSYLFKIKFTQSLVEVYINNNLELNITGNFSDGAYGFYNYSQSTVNYAAVEASNDVESDLKPTAHAGDDQNVTLGEEIVLDGSLSSSDTEIVSYLWKEEDTILGIGENISIHNLSLGSHTLTLTVINDNANSATDSMVIWVRE
jgi:hypothetical protein